MQHYTLNNMVSNNCFTPTKPASIILERGGGESASLQQHPRHQPKNFASLASSALQTKQISQQFPPFFPPPPNYPNLRFALPQIPPLCNPPHPNPILLTSFAKQTFSLTSAGFGHVQALDAHLAQLPPSSHRHLTHAFL